MAITPAHFLEAWQGKNVEPTPAMDKGSFIHKLLLELSLEGFAPWPLNDDGTKTRSNSKEYVDWFAKLKTGTKVIDPKIFKDASDILSSAVAHKKFVEFWEASDKEVSYYAKDRHTGLYMKCRHDMIAKDHSFTLDVKSVADILKFERQIFSLGYDIKQAHYKEVTMAVTGKTSPKGYFFAIESKPPYTSKMFTLSIGTEISAQDQWRQWMNMVSVCEQEGAYPGFSQEVFEAERPAYLDKSELSFEDAI